MTQTNLGNALSTLGERESGNARLTEAVAAYHEALQDFDPERSPYYWQATQGNLNKAQAMIAEPKAQAGSSAGKL